MNPAINRLFSRQFLFVFVVGILFAFFLHFTRVPNRSNPLLSTLSLRDVVLIWYYQKPVQRCLLERGQEKIYECANDILRIVARKYGAKLALNVIEPVSQNEPVYLALGHDLAHTIGNSALYASYGVGQGLREVDEDRLIQKMGRVIVDCDGWGSFGCYHGVIEVALSRIEPGRRTAMIRKACLENPLVISKQYYLNQCMHWFGHGMTIFTEQTLTETLAMCESVSSNFYSDEVQLCLSGVFHAGALPGTSDATYLTNVSRVYNKNDVYFPCRDIEERFRGHCFSHVVGRSHTGDLSVMMRNCDGIPEGDPSKKRIYVERCYESIGNNLLINANFTSEGVAEACDRLAGSAYMGFCYGGAARYNALRDPLLTNTLPFAICKRAPASAKKTCYALAGFANFENYKSKTIMQDYCANAEDGYQVACEALET